MNKNHPASRKNLHNSQNFIEIISRNEKILSIFQSIESIAPSFQPVLLTGETGVGKDLFAQSIHKASGRTGELVTVNVAGLDDNVFSDTLFGHVKGAYTGAEKERKGLLEKACGGSLFLDEIGDLSLASQVKLLRLIQENEYMTLGSDEVKQADVRIIAVTNQDLWGLQREGRFRNDLNFRLRTHHINIPPLRERREDIPLLLDHFLESASAALNKKKPTPPKELTSLLENYYFPGNVRELQAMVHDAVSRHTSRMLSLDVFQDHIDSDKHGIKVEAAKLSPDDPIYALFSGNFPTLKEATMFLVDEALKKSDGNISAAAKLLGISRQALSKRLKN